MVDVMSLLDALRLVAPERADAIARHATRASLARHIAVRRAAPDQPSDVERWAWRERLATLPRKVAA